MRLYCTMTNGELEELGGAGMALIDVVVDRLAKGEPRAQARWRRHHASALAARMVGADGGDTQGHNLVFTRYDHRAKTSTKLVNQRNIPFEVSLTPIHDLTYH